jgi:hypothetical protein
LFFCFKKRGKAELFGDKTMAQKILETPDPAKVKGKENCCDLIKISFVCCV